MAKLIVSELKTSGRGIEFKVALNNGVNTIKDYRLSEKDIFMEAIKNDKVLDELPNIEWIDRGFEPNIIRHILEQTENKLIIIDDADWILPKCGIKKRDIQDDNKNQYLLITKYGWWYGTKPEHEGEFIRQGDVVTLQYPNEMSKEKIMNMLKELKSQERFKDYKMGLAGSYARGEETEESDIDIVVDTDMLSFEDIMFIKNYFGHTEVDILQLKLLRDHDIELDHMLIDMGMEENDVSVYKSIVKDVIWCE